MEDILIKKLDYCKKILLEKIAKSSKKLEDLGSITEEWFLFEKQSRENGDFSLASNYRKCNSVYKFQLIIYNELKNIKSFKYISNDIDDILSEYGSFYCGNKILYYNDNLISYNDEQFLQIILNHIMHYTSERFLTREYEEATESLILLSFYHLRIFDFKIKYSQSCRKYLYNEDIYKNIIKDLILFKPKKSLKSFIFNNKINTNFYYVKDNFIHGIKIHITEEMLSFVVYNVCCKKTKNQCYFNENKSYDMLENFKNFSQITDKTYNTYFNNYYEFKF